MALCLGKTKTVLNNLKGKVGLMGIIERSVWSSSLTQHKKSLAAPAIAQKLTNLHSNIGVSATLLTSRRFESVKAERVFDTQYDFVANQVSFCYTLCMCRCIY